ncbi:unnamed protein product [Dibothriocephalus latus]|uniref:Uncharacterized protein n=1 Tax=Dibothriocephalus latus TaxID=60516 RepID=A0A3P7NL27_DIBLA|nr:unnamed protein product [Dibothriocephalus latus]
MQKALETHKNLIQSTLSVQNASTPATTIPDSRLTDAAHDGSCQCSSSSGNTIFAPGVSVASSMQREESGPGFEVPAKVRLRDSHICWAFYAM